MRNAHFLSGPSPPNVVNLEAPHGREGHFTLESRHMSKLDERKKAVLIANAGREQEIAPPRAHGEAMQRYIHRTAKFSERVFPGGAEGVIRNNGSGSGNRK
jgi:hypothetical protein